MENIETYMQQVGKQARAASRRMALAGTADKNRTLEAIAQSLDSAAALVAENAGTWRPPARTDWMRLP